MTVVSAERLADVFVELADTLVDDFDVIEFLMMVTHRAAELIGDADVGLLLADQRGKLQFMAGSNEDVKRLELFQVQVHEGPCLDAFVTAQAVVNADLREAEERWPLFAPRAAGAGYRSVHAFPLRLRRDVIGAIGVFGTNDARWEDADVHIAQTLAHVATIGLLQERAVRHGEILTEQLQSALNSRIVIEQAKGAVAESQSISMDDAFQILREHARRSGTHLVEAAHAALSDPATLYAVRRDLSEPPPREHPVDSTPRTDAAGSRGLSVAEQAQALVALGDARDSAAEVRDHNDDAHLGPEAEGAPGVARAWAGRDRDAAASDRADLIDLITHTDRPDVSRQPTGREGDQPAGENV